MTSDPYFDLAQEAKTDRDTVKRVLEALGVPAEMKWRSNPTGAFSMLTMYFKSPAIMQKWKTILEHMAGVS